MLQRTVITAPHGHGPLMTVQSVVDEQERRLRGTSMIIVVAVSLRHGRLLTWYCSSKMRIHAKVYSTVLETQFGGPFHQTLDTEVSRLWPEFASGPLIKFWHGVSSGCSAIDNTYLPDAIRRQLFGCTKPFPVISLHLHELVVSFETTLHEYKGDLTPRKS